MLEQPYRVDASLLRILAESEAWVIPADSATHPVAVAFYVPRRLVPLLESTAPKPIGANRPAERPPLHLMD